MQQLTFKNTCAVDLTVGHRQHISSFLFLQASSFFLLVPQFFLLFLCRYIIFGVFLFSLIFFSLFFCHHMSKVDRDDILLVLTLHALVQSGPCMRLLNYIFQCEQSSDFCDVWMACVKLKPVFQGQRVLTHMGRSRTINTNQTCLDCVFLWGY